ncbi:MAG: hypothetical protein HOG39_06960 [Candidatus Marinimicrobia bacterium]|jgi:hypothetical protein|nr:hypothetical protein [Candidatus Neomarinimicrobiota bacterium]
MKDNRQIFEIVGFISIVVSLGFVGLEIRQNTSAVRGATNIAISDQVMDMALEISSNERLGKLVSFMMEDNIKSDELSPEDRTSLQMLVYAGLRRIENVYLQVEEGILDKQAFDRVGMGFYRTNIARDTWDIYGGYFGKDFIPFFESLRDSIDTK